MSEIEYIEMQQAALKKYKQALDFFLTSVESKQQSVEIREREMAEADGLDYTDNQISMIVDKIIKDSPLNINIKIANDKVSEAVKGNG